MRLPKEMTREEFSAVNVTREGKWLRVEVTLVHERGATEGWQTGVALDASDSMRSWYGKRHEGKLPEAVAERWKKEGKLRVIVKDGKQGIRYTDEAIRLAIKEGYAHWTPNIVEPCARDFITYLAGEIDADGETTVIYWACGDGSVVEVLGDFSAERCRKLEVQGPAVVPFGVRTCLTPAVEYFVDRFKKAKQGLYVFLTDGKLNDQKRVTEYTIELSKAIASGKRNPVKCVLIGVGDAVDKQQLEELNHLDRTHGTEVDIWDSEVVERIEDLPPVIEGLTREMIVVADKAVITDAEGVVVKVFPDDDHPNGLPAKIDFLLPDRCPWFELEVGEDRVRQPLTVSRR